MKRKIMYVKEIVKQIILDIKYLVTFLKNYENDQEVMFSILRTNAHILDKGIHIVPFEKGHSEKIYYKCKELISKITEKKILKDDSYLWALQVISNYEYLQEDNVFKLPKVEIQEINDYEKKIFYKVLKNRISTRNFNTQKISDEIWDEIITYAAFAPSGCCRQPTRYYIESNPKKINALVENIAGATGFNGFIPYLICVTTDIRAYGYKDKLLPIIDGTLNIENFLLTCSANNIHTTVLNWQHASLKNNSNVKSILQIPEFENIIVFIAAGKSDNIPEQPKRLNLHWIKKN